MAGKLESSVPRAVALERRAGPVVGEPVELDDEPAVGPSHVDLVAGEADVDGRRREPGLAAEYEEPFLELRARVGRGADMLPHNGTQERRPAVPVTPVEKALKGGHVEQAEAVRSFERSLEPRL